MKKHHLTIRKATVSNTDKIEDVMKQSMRALGEGYYNNEQIASSCKYVCVPDHQIITDGTYYVVEDEDGIMLGCGGWSFRNTLYAGPKAHTKQTEIAGVLDPLKDAARIRAMFVSPLAAGKGVGSLISEQEARKSGFRQGILGATQSGRAFYLAKGWHPLKEEIATLPDGVEIEITQMTKEFV